MSYGGLVNWNLCHLDWAKRIGYGMDPVTDLPKFRPNVGAQFLHTYPCLVMWVRVFW